MHPLVIGVQALDVLLTEIMAVSFALPVGPGCIRGRFCILVTLLGVGPRATSLSHSEALSRK